jgi:chromosome segregation and condensation protein ScpB
MYGGRDVAINRLLEKGFIEQMPATSPGQEPKFKSTQAWLDYLENESLQVD